MWPITNPPPPPPPKKFLCIIGNLLSKYGELSIVFLIMWHIISQKTVLCNIGFATFFSEKIRQKKKTKKKISTTVYLLVSCKKGGELLSVIFKKKNITNGERGGERIIIVC
jgi:hypothetical protein